VLCHYGSYETFFFVAGALAVMLVSFPLWMLWKAFRSDNMLTEAQELAAQRAHGMWKSLSKEERAERTEDCLRDLRLRHDYKESLEYYEAVDFLRKVLILCCAWVKAGSVARPVYASLICLAFSFSHIRLFPYRRLETNVLKAVSDYTIFFVFFLCSLKAADPSGDMLGDSFSLVETVIFLLWRGVVPLCFIAAIFLNVARQRTLRSNNQELISNPDLGNALASFGSPSGLSIELQPVENQPDLPEQERLLEPLLEDQPSFSTEHFLRTLDPVRASGALRETRTLSSDPASNES
jgi:hypothetical protein